VEIRQLADADRPWLREMVDQEWGLPVVSISGVYDPSDYPGFVVTEDGNRVGAATYRLTSETCELVTINAITPGKGIGSALLAAVKDVADDRGVRLWLITTNENIRAIEFYQRRGMDMVALHRDFVHTVRQHKPSIDDQPTAGIPFRHAIEFSY
jgi:GNAT superfamily N-acetyltransferase